MSAVISRRGSFLRVMLSRNSARQGAVYLRMKAHIDELERKVGVPPRLS